jgi:hypothetical protein
MVRHLSDFFCTYAGLLGCETAQPLFPFHPPETLGVGASPPGTLLPLLPTLWAPVMFHVSWAPVTGTYHVSCRMVFRLDGPNRRAAAPPMPLPEDEDPNAELGSIEQSVISKYGGEDFFHSEDEAGEQQ